MYGSTNDGTQRAPPGAYDPSMGQSAGSWSQTPMYDASMGHMSQPIMGDAEARWAALREEKESRKTKRDVEKVLQSMRAGNRNQSDNTCCANILCFWGIFNALCWAVPLLGDSWWHKPWFATGIRSLEVSVGLVNMQISLQCSKVSKVIVFDDNPENQLCASIKTYSEHDGGHWDISDFRDEMCLRVPNKCPMMNRLAQAGYAPLCLLPVAAAFEVLAILLLYFYWNGKPTASIRRFSFKAAWMAPAIGHIGLCCWLRWSPDISDLPRIWAREKGLGAWAGSVHMGLKTGNGQMGWCRDGQPGWCPAIVGFAIISSFIRCFVQATQPYSIHESVEVLTGEGEDQLMAEAERIVTSRHTVPNPEGTEDRAQSSGSPFTPADQARADALSRHTTH